MRKRLLSILLALAMVMCTAPLAVFADEGGNDEPTAGVTNDTNTKEGEDSAPNNNITLGGSLTNNSTTPSGDTANNANSLGATLTNSNASETYVDINDTNFPDAKFLAFVKDYDTNKDDKLSASELAVVTSMDCRDRTIADLTGIEYFTALTSLICRDNKLTALDVSQNTALAELDCTNTNLATLDVSQNTALTKLNCGDNKLTALDTSNNTALEALGCYQNKLTELNLNRNIALTSLNCGYNNLTELNLNKNTALTSLVCEGNKLTKLDISNNTALTILNCSHNSLTTLAISNNKALTILNCSSNKLTSLDLSNNTALEKLYCYYNALTSLDVSRNTKLTELNCNVNALTSLDLSKIESSSFTLKADNNIYNIMPVNGSYNLENLPEGFDESKVVSGSWNGGSVTDGKLTIDDGVEKVTYKYDCGKGKEVTFTLLTYVDINEANFPDENFREFVKQYDTNNNQKLSASELSAVTSMDCSDKSIADLTGIEYFTSLKKLYCYSNALTSLDLSNNTELTDFNGSNNVYTITPVNGKYDLSKLPGNFDVSKASNWKGAKVENGILIIDKNADKVTYTYDCGNGKTGEFTLLIAKSDSKSPKTGDSDSSNLALWFALLLACGAVTGATGARLSRDRKSGR